LRASSTKAGHNAERRVRLLVVLLQPIPDIGGSVAAAVLAHLKEDIGKTADIG
jgi:hypothetical protein